MKATAPVLVALAVLALAGCGARPGAVSFDDDLPAGRTPYSGALVKEPTEAERASRWDWPGAAGDVVQCSSPPHGQTVVGVNTEGAVADDPRAAIEVKRGEGLFLDASDDALVLERDEGDRVLFTTSFDDIARQALIVRDGPSGPGTGAKDGHGWYVESFAACDLADFPERVAAARGVEVWSGRDGGRVPTSSVVSASGPQHCSWQSMTLLTLGDGTKDARLYVAHPLTELDEYFDRPYLEHVHVPTDAMDTGYEREGRHLWLSPEEEYAYVGSSDDAEAWPRAIHPLGCA